MNRTSNPIATALASLDDHGLSFMELYIARLNPAFSNDENSGHKDAKTTTKYYTEVSKADLRAAVKRLWAFGS